MKPLLIYLLQVIAISGILFAYYHFALRNNSFHKYNRYYLILSAIISLIIPFFNIPVYFTEEQTSSSPVLQSITHYSLPSLPKTPTIYPSYHAIPPTHPVNWTTILFFIYILIVSLILVRLFISIYRICRIAHDNPSEKLEGIVFINTNHPDSPFSFFSWLFWNKEMTIESSVGNHVFRHEYFHIQQRHTLDILFFEALSTIFWINPFFYLYKKEIKAVQEFLADEYALQANNDNDVRLAYGELLLMRAFETRQRLVTPFFHNQIKRRITMIMASGKPAFQYLRKVLVLPVAAIVIGFFALSYRVRADERMIIIEGNVPAVPDGPIYLVEAHFWNKFLDSTTVRNGHFKFEIRPTSTFEPFVASLKFPNAKSSNKLSGLMFAIAPRNSQVEKGKFYSTDGFYLDSGRTEVMEEPGKKPETFPSGFVSIPVIVKAGIENELFFKNNSIDFGWPGGSANQRKAKLNSIISQIKQYPYSYFLLSTIYDNRGGYSIEELLRLLRLFTEPVQHSTKGVDLLRLLTVGTDKNEIDVTKPIVDTVDSKKTKEDTSSVKMMPFIYSNPEELVLQADTIILKDGSEIKNGMKTYSSRFTEALWIVDGERVGKDYSDGRSLISKKIIFYPAHNSEAVTKYGKEAQYGLIEFFGVRIFKYPRKNFYADMFDTKPRNSN
jgi:beta-lactamase regulating signal transducer with metallopeptidase domain